MRPSNPSTPAHAPVAPVSPPLATNTGTPWAEITLAPANGANPVPANLPIIVVSKTGMVLGGRVLARRVGVGFDPAAMNGNSGSIVEPLLAALREAKVGDEIVIAFDASTPFVAVHETVETARSAKVRRVHLVTAGPGGRAVALTANLMTRDEALTVELASLEMASIGGGTPASQPYRLSVTVDDGGISLRERGGELTEGCRTLGSGPAVPTKAGA